VGTAIAHACLYGIELICAYSKYWNSVAVESIYPLQADILAFESSAIVCLSG